MDRCRCYFYGWSWEENKVFELALAVVEEDNPRRWDVVAMMVGGRSAEEVEKHYNVLLEDLKLIESGCMDHLCLLSDCTRQITWTDEDQKLDNSYTRLFYIALDQARVLVQLKGDVEGAIGIGDGHNTFVSPHLSSEIA